MPGDGELAKPLPTVNAHGGSSRKVGASTMSRNFRLKIAIIEEAGITGAICRSGHVTGNFPHLQSIHPLGATGCNAGG